MFAGIGGICLAFRNAGAEMVWANEIDADACKTYRGHFGPKYLEEGDVRNVNAQSVPPLDILTAGFPCQAFSVAGYRKGFEDDRGILFFQIIRIIEAKSPRVVFIENVKNLVKHDGGRTFECVCKCLRDCGYIIDHRVFNTKEYGNIPQNRERVYIVAFKNEKDLKNFSWPEPIRLEKTVASITHPGVKAEDCFYYTEESQYHPMLDKDVRNKETVYQLRRTYVRENKNNVCPTLTANMGGGGHNVPLIRDDYGVRKLTPEECLRLQGFPGDFNFAPAVRSSGRYKQAGNSVSVPVVQRIAERILKALEGADTHADRKDSR
jgi:DNA (cytosine-5)-methyltransferase 1